MMSALALASTVVLFATQATAYTFVHGISLGYPIVLPSVYIPIRVAHASLACVAWVVLFPLGGLIIRWLPRRWLPRAHAYMQIFAYVCFLAAACLGIWMSRGGGITNQYHPILGLLTLGLTTVQLMLGSRNHYVHVQKRGRETMLHVPLGTFHVWFGRLLITLGMLVGGTGFLWSNSSCHTVRIIYGVAAGVIWLAFVFGNVLAWEYFKPATGFSLKGNTRVREGGGRGEERLTGTGPAAGGVEEEEYFEPKI